MTYARYSRKLYSPRGLRKKKTILVLYSFCCKGVSEFFSVAKRSTIITATTATNQIFTLITNLTPVTHVYKSVFQVSLIEVKTKQIPFINLLFKALRISRDGISQLTRKNKVINL